MKHAIGPRREMKLRTIFNLLGPLTNPARAERQLIGVFSEEKAEQMAAVLAALGCERAWVVHGRDGHDEISLHAPTAVFPVEAGRLGPLQVLDPPGGLAAESGSGDRGRSGRQRAPGSTDCLRGERQGPSREIVPLNAAAALHVAGRAVTLEERARAGHARRSIAVMRPRSSSGCER